MPRTIELTLDPNIVPNWGFWEAIREVVQGAIDSGETYNFDYDMETETLTITNRGKLSKQSLLIGHSTKRGDKSKIGEHGEGYKLAATVLLRLGKKFSIHNDNEIWAFGIKYSKKFNTDIIYVSSASWFVPETDQIVWSIENVSPEEYDEIKDKIVSAGDIKVSNGWILLDRPGDIFVGGLYVCTTGLTYGYNFNPGVLVLHRDRNIVSDFDLQWETSIAWRDQPEAASLALEDVPDVQYIASTYKGSVSTEAYNIFFKTYGASAIPCSLESHKVLGGYNVIVPDSFRKLVLMSPNYKAVKASEATTPRSQLSVWYENVKVTRGFEDADFEELLIKAKKWYAME